jgi:hypothetical protein
VKAIWILNSERNRVTAEGRWEVVQPEQSAMRMEQWILESGSDTVSLW